MSAQGRSRAHSRGGVLLVALLSLSLAVPGALAGPPSPGLFVPGQSLGGIRVSMTKAQVRRIWGSSFGRCKDCLEETWYYNYVPFAPQGVGVAFARSRVVRVFTVWQPDGWRTSGGLALGASEADLTRAYGSLERRRCSGYHALILSGASVRSVFYVYKDALWGFALMRPSLSPC